MTKLETQLTHWERSWPSSRSSSVAPRSRDRTMTSPYTRLKAEKLAARLFQHMPHSCG